MLRLDDAVSIHAPREGCDVAESVKGFFLRGFNSRTPGGVRLGVNKPNTNLRKFQFTHPGRGATPSQSKSLHHGGSFNSRTPGGVRPVCRSTRPSDQAVSIHAPREGCDARRHHQDRGADEVSIHAPREGCDGTCQSLPTPRLSVSIHAPREGCDIVMATTQLSPRVSIHAPREGCDRPPSPRS